MIQAQLVYLTSQQTFAALPLPPHGASIGRATGCTVVTADAQVSQQHAVLKLVKSTWHIEDLRSTNGTLVNGTRISAPTPLRHMDIIGCGSLQLRFMLVTSAEQATLADRAGPAPADGKGDFPALRDAIALLKKERDELLEKLEQGARELTGANAENRKLRQAQEELRGQHATLRREHEDTLAAQAKAQAILRAAAAERERQKQQAEELVEKLRAMQAELLSQGAARHQAEQESQRLKERVVTLEEDSARLAARRDEALALLSQRQAEMNDLRPVSNDWERHQAQSEAEARVKAEQIRQLLAELDEQQARLRGVQVELGQLRQRYDEKNAQHRGLRSEFDQLSAELERHRDQARRQSERLARDKEALHQQLQELQLAAEKAHKASGQLPEAALAQLAAELRQSLQALALKNAELGTALTLALRWHAKSSQANPGDAAAPRVRDRLEEALAHADQADKLLQQLVATVAPLRAQADHGPGRAAGAG